MDRQNETELVLPSAPEAQLGLSHVELDGGGKNDQVKEEQEDVP